MNATTSPSRKMHVQELRNLAIANGVTKGLYGTSKESLVRMITRAQAENTKEAK